jgi:hypothetical protein
MPDPAPFAPASFRELAYFYAGAFMALAYVSASTFPFRLVPFVWSFLAGRELRLADVEAIDAEFARQMAAVTAPDFADADPELLAGLFPATFQVQNARGATVDLVPGGAGVSVTDENRGRYADLCREFRVGEFMPALRQIRDGFWAIFPQEAAVMLHPLDLKDLVCGDDDCPVEELMKHCTVSSDPNGRAPMFWKVMGAFEPEERLEFIRFASGRSGLPPPGARDVGRIQINFERPENRAPGNERLANAGTCFSRIDIPYYPTEEIMARKLRAAFKFSPLISDGGIRTDELAQFL